MHKHFTLFAAILCTLSSLAQNGKPVYDSALAKKLGADNYGMKQYVMAFLTAGPNRNMDSAQKSQLIMAHLKNIGRLANEGKLVVAGPFLDDGKYAGIFIFNVTTVEEARDLVKTDPAVKAGIFDMELHPWYGSAAMMQINETHSKVQKTSITD